jgi:DNA-binding GntR family transcriptional regulator
LEEFAIELLIPNIEEKDILDLEDHLNVMRKTAEQGDVAELLELDLQFHKKLYALSNHGMLIDVLNGLSRQTHMFILLTKVVYTLFPTLQDIADSHEPLLDAIRHKNIQAATFEIQKHINDVGDRIFDIMEIEEKSGS